MDAGFGREDRVVLEWISCCRLEAFCSRINWHLRLWVSFSGSRQAEQVQGGDNLVIRETAQET